MCNMVNSTFFEFSSFFNNKLHYVIKYFITLTCIISKFICYIKFEKVPSPNGTFLFADVLPLPTITTNLTDLIDLTDLVRCKLPLATQKFSSKLTHNEALKPTFLQTA